LKKGKGEILHCVQNDKKQLVVILEEPKGTKDLGLCKAHALREKGRIRGIMQCPA